MSKEIMINLTGSRRRPDTTEGGSISRKGKNVLVTADEL